MKRISILAAILATTAAPAAAQDGDAQFRQLFQSWQEGGSSADRPVQARRGGRTFADYNPCDKADPDYGGSDLIACDIERGRAGSGFRYGTQIAYDMIYAARLGREARKQMRHWEAKYGSF